MRRFYSSFSQRSPFSLIILLLFFFDAIRSQKENELLILIGIKQAWNNPPFLSSWSSESVSPCNWTGVTCSNGFVSEIYLPNLNITGPLPNSFGKLVSLKKINLSNNSIDGEFPTFLYSCSELENLDLSQNYFDGIIPSDVYRMSNLRHLNLSGNNFHGEIPPGIGLFLALETLHLYQNAFNVSIPPEIGNISTLQNLSLAYNPFSTAKIPQELGRLQNLKELWLAKMNLVGEIPESLGNLTNLTRLDLSMNYLVGNIPGRLFMMKKLRNLFLYKNNLRGELPKVIEAFDLEELDLSINQLSGSIPEDFGKLKKLKLLVMYNNRLSGNIPVSIARISSLAKIKLFNNSLTGIIPRELGFYSSLQSLEVSNNLLTGNLPENLCEGGILKNLVVFSNKLTGTFPPNLANCRSLTNLYLYDNRFSGEFPSVIWSYNLLDMVLISDNSFSGELPEGLPNSLKRLEINNNRFSGKIPSKISECENLNVFTARNNLFSGEIPSTLTELSNLETLNLAENNLSGEFPSKIISWKHLVVLNLRKNKISGTISPEIGRLPSLTYLDLSENLLTGEIPRDLGLLRLSFLNLSSNQLTGSVPPELDSPAYFTSFINNLGICAITKNLNVRLCNSSEFRKSSKLSSRHLALILTLAAVINLIAVLIAFYVINDMRRRKKNSQDSATWKITSFQKMEFSESKILQSLTEDNVIGAGGSGQIYRIGLGNGHGDSVAVKKIWTGRSIQRETEKEFQAEIEILSSLRHSNIVRLLCCLSNENAKLLVYEYMENGSLDRWIHNTSRRNNSGFDSSGSSRLSHMGHLDWTTRLRIAMGAAQGLCYMHHGCSQPILHRDVKSSNILLDKDFNAKVADFGLAKILSKGGEAETFTTVAGSFGYIAPEYGYTTKVNEKSDVYSFGVVLLELVTGREASCVDDNNHTCLAEWVSRQFSGRYKPEQLLDQTIMEPCIVDQMIEVLTLGIVCTGVSPSSRPTMREVLLILLRCYHRHAFGNIKPRNESDTVPLLPEV